MLNTKETLIAQHFLKQHSNDLGCSVCNDWNFPTTWSTLEKQEFLKQYYAWNGDPENYNPKQLRMSDFMVVDFLAHRMTASNNDYSIKLSSNYDCKESWLLNYISPEQQKDLLQTIANLNGPYILHFKQFGHRTVIKAFNTQDDYLVDLTNYEDE